MVTTQAPPPDDPTGTLTTLPLEALVPNAAQPRKTFDARKLDELKESIAAAGLVQPIVVRPVTSDDGDMHMQYEIVVGERRWRAYQELACEDSRFATIPAVIRELDEAEAAVAALVENVVRDDLNPIERAEALEALQAKLGVQWKEVAERVGLSERTVYHLRKMLRLPKTFQTALADGRINDNKARALSKLLTKSKDGALDLYEYLMANPKVSGTAAHKIARVLAHDDGYSAEEAHAYVKAPKAQQEEWGRRRLLPREAVVVEQTPVRVFLHGLRTMSRVMEEISVAELSEEERAEIEAEARRVLEWLG